MIFLKRRALMTRFSFNYKTASGIGSLVLEKCSETFFKQFKLLGNSVQQETPSLEFPQEIKSVGEYNSDTGKYDVDVKVTRKNLFDMDKFIDTCKFTKNEDGTFKIDKFVKRYDCFIPANTILSIETLKIEDSSGAAVLELIFEDGKSMYVGFSTVGVKTFLIQKDVAYIKVLAYRHHVYKYIQIEKGTTATPYEPYKEPQTIKLSLDQPLRGIGEHKDVITKDGIVRRIKQIVLNGSENWTLHPNTSKEKTQSFGLVIPVKCYSANTGLMSNRFKKLYTVWIYDIEGIDVFGGHTLYINIEKTKASNVEEFKKWLSENTVIVEVILAEPIIEPLAEESKKALESLYTNEGTTVIAVDSGEVEAGIEVEYAVKE